MKRLILLPCAAALLAVAACSKPAEQPVDAAQSGVDAAGEGAEGAASAAGDAASGAMAPGGVVSPPAENAAVDTSADADAGAAAAANSFTEGQARGHLENAGYTDVSGLTKTPDGLWTGQAKKDGRTVSVSVDFKGAVTAK